MIWREIVAYLDVHCEAFNVVFEYIIGHGLQQGRQIGAQPRLNSRLAVRHGMRSRYHLYSQAQNAIRIDK